MDQLRLTEVVASGHVEKPTSIVLCCGVVWCGVDWNASRVRKECATQ
jgi:hypothetical protein